MCLSAGCREVAKPRCSRLPACARAAQCLGGLLAGHLTCQQARVLGTAARADRQGVGACMQARCRAGFIKHHPLLCPAPPAAARRALGYHQVRWSWQGTCGHVLCQAVSGARARIGSLFSCPGMAGTPPAMRNHRLEPHPTTPLPNPPPIHRAAASKRRTKTTRHPWR